MLTAASDWESEEFLLHASTSMATLLATVSATGGSCCSLVRVRTS
jgi:hypothetical protein